MSSLSEKNSKIAFARVNHLEISLINLDRGNAKANLYFLLGEVYWTLRCVLWFAIILGREGRRHILTEWLWRHLALQLRSRLFLLSNFVFLLCKNLLGLDCSFQLLRERLHVSMASSRKVATQLVLMRIYPTAVILYERELIWLRNVRLVLFIPSHCQISHQFIRRWLNLWNKLLIHRTSNALIIVQGVLHHMQILIRYGPCDNLRQGVESLTKRLLIHDLLESLLSWRWLNEWPIVWWLDFILRAFNVDEVSVRLLIKDIGNIRYVKVDGWVKMLVTDSHDLNVFIVRVLPLRMPVETALDMSSLNIALVLLVMTHSVNWLLGFVIKLFLCAQVLQIIDPYPRALTHIVFVNLSLITFQASSLNLGLQRLVDELVCLRGWRIKTFMMKEIYLLRAIKDTAGDAKIRLVRFRQFAFFLLKFVPSKFHISFTLAN